MTPALKLKTVSHFFGEGRSRVHVLDRVNLTIDQGEFVCLFGPNGSGKSTLIEIATGLAPAASGEVQRCPSHSEHIIPVVFQDFRRSLLPWANVADNILFPLKLAGIGRSKRIQVLEELIKEFDTNIDPLARISTLSGGQAQTVSIMRALSVSPRLLVCDEPFSALDYEARLALQQLLMRLAKKRGFAVLMVSHDLDEAILLGDRVIFLSHRPGKVIGELINPQARPRRTEDMSTELFAELRRHGLNLFRKATQPNDFG